MKKAIFAIFTIFELGFNSEAIAEDESPLMLKSSQQNQLNKNIYQQYYSGDQNYYAPTNYNQQYYPYEQEPLTSYRGNHQTANDGTGSSRAGVSYYYQ